MDEDVKNRRKSDMPEYQDPLVTAIAKLETIPERVDVKLDALKEVVEVQLESLRKDIKNLEGRIGSDLQRVDERINAAESKIAGHCEETEEVNQIIDKHDRTIERAKDYIQEIDSLKRRVSQCEREIKEVKEVPKEVVYSGFKAVMQKIGWSVLAFLGAALAYALFNIQSWAGPAANV